MQVDARGMRCPWPVLRLARAMREAGPDGRVVLLADDPKAEGEVRALADAQGWTLEVDAIDGAARFTVAA